MIAPRSLSAYFTMGLVYAVTGKLQEAVECLHKALMRNQKDAISLK
jgi:tetratricopeptide (TPR) repeat protein